MLFDHFPGDIRFYSLFIFYFFGSTCDRLSRKKHFFVAANQHSERTGNLLQTVLKLVVGPLRAPVTAAIPVRRFGGRSWRTAQTQSRYQKALLMME